MTISLTFHDRFVCAQVVDREHAAGLYFQVIGKAAVERQAVSKGKVI